jgi:hypothetical protein
LGGMADAKRTGQRDLLVTLMANSALIGIKIGEWDAAASTLSEVGGLDLDPADRFITQTNQVVLSALRGEPYQALLQEASDFAAASGEPQVLASVEAARGWVALAQGQYLDAYAASHRSAVLSKVNIADDLPVAARGALWAGDVDRARSAVEEFRTSGIHGRAIHTNRLIVEAGIAALEGRMEDAVNNYRDAQRQWRDLGAWFDLAMTGLDLVRLVGGERPDIEAAATEAREIFTRLGTPVMLQRLDESLGIART